MTHKNTGVAPRTSIYIDAFNLYFGSLKNTPYKWLNVELMCNFLLKKNDIVGIKYFTAKVIPRENDPHQPIRQQMYFRALRTIKNIEIIYGHYLSHEVKMLLATPLFSAEGKKQKYATVLKTEEKGSDVNLATHLLHDAHLDIFDVAVVISNDSDLLEPIKIIRNHFKKKVGIINPHKKQSVVLKKNSDFVKQIREGVLRESQFSSLMKDDVGEFHKPKGW
jgi:uncharacterized LabA/DUF88 family protein